MTARAIPGIRYGWDQPLLLLGDLIFRRRHEGSPMGPDKRRGANLPKVGVVAKRLGDYGSAERSRFGVAYLVYVKTSRGDLQMDVTVEEYNRLKIGGTIKVRYRQGRFTGALEGRIIE